MAKKKWGMEYKQYITAASKKRKILAVKSVLNVRDLGGIPTMDGRFLKEGYFLRGAGLSELTKRDARKLEKKYGVHTVIDLRTSQERKEKPDKNIPCAVMFQIPIFDEQTSGISREKERRVKDKVKAIPDMAQLYRNMVTREDYVANLKEIMGIIVRETLKPATVQDEGGTAGSALEGKVCGTGGPAVYYHCTAGKDRTGIVSMLILSICNVSREEIIADYVLTNKVNVPRDNFRWLAVSAILRDKNVSEGLAKVFRADPTYLTAAMDAIEETYGSMDNFLTNTLGISKEDRENLKNTILKPV